MYKVLYGSEPSSATVIGKFKTAKEADHFIWNEIEKGKSRPQFIRIYHSNDLNSIVYDLGSSNTFYYLEGSGISIIVDREGVLLNE